MVEKQVGGVTVITPVVNKEPQPPTKPEIPALQVDQNADVKQEE